MSTILPTTLMPAFGWYDADDVKDEAELLVSAVYLATDPHSKPPATTAFIKDPNNRYRASSAWQKCIRRGDALGAVKFVNAIYDLDPAYVWRRICVIAIEDIGVANPLLVAIVFAVSGKVKWREKFANSKVWAAILTQALARSDKDRTCCDTVVWVQSDPDLHEARERFFCTHGTDTAMVYDTTEFLAHRLLSLWSMAGTKRYRFEGEDYQGLDEVPGAFQTYLNSLPFVVRYICRRGGNLTQDAMPLAFSLLYRMVQATDKAALQVRHDRMIAGELIANYPAEAYDQHTSHGKKALRLFVRTCKPLRDYLEAWCMTPAQKLAMDAEQVTEHLWPMVGSVVFREEGAALDKRLMYAGAADIYDLCATGRYRFRGVPVDQIDAIGAMVWANLPVLNWCRRYIMGQGPLDGGDQPPGKTLGEVMPEILATSAAYTDVMESSTWEASTGLEASFFGDKGPPPSLALKALWSAVDPAGGADATGFVITKSVPPKTATFGALYSIGKAKLASIPPGGLKVTGLQSVAALAGSALAAKWVVFDEAEQLALFSCDKPATLSPKEAFKVIVALLQPIGKGVSKVKVSKEMMEAAGALFDMGMWCKETGGTITAMLDGGWLFEAPKFADGGFVLYDPDKPLGGVVGPKPVVIPLSEGELKGLNPIISIDMAVQEGVAFSGFDAAMKQAMKDSMGLPSLINAHAVKPADLYKDMEGIKTVAYGGEAPVPVVEIDSLPKLYEEAAKKPKPFSWEEYAAEYAFNAAPNDTPPAKIPLAIGEEVEVKFTPVGKKPPVGKWTKKVPADFASKVLKGSAGKQTSLFDLLKKG